MKRPGRGEGATLNIEHVGLTGKREGQARESGGEKEEKQVGRDIQNFEVNEAMLIWTERSSTKGCGVWTDV